MGGGLMTTPDPQLLFAYEEALTGAGVPVNLASLCAEIVANDDASKPDLGRSVDDQHLINSSMEWMKAKGFFDAEGGSLRDHR
jgi:hypothetical protein